MGPMDDAVSDHRPVLRRIRVGAEPPDPPVLSVASLGVVLGQALRQVLRESDV